MPFSTKLSRSLLGAILLLAGCSNGLKPVSGQRAMPTFELESLDGPHFSSKALAGRVALVDFWATWCQPCLEEIPFWDRLYDRYGDRGFTVLGITVQSGWASDIKSDIQTLKLEIKYPVVVGNEKIAREFGGVLGFPTTFLITRDGWIYKKYVGQYAAKETEIETDIQKLLSQRH